MTSGRKNHFTILLSALAIFVLSFGCNVNGNDDDPPLEVRFLSAVQAGGESGTADSASLTLSFGDDPASLTAGDITVTGAAKGALSGSGSTRSLAISDISVADNAEVSIRIDSPAGYAISGSPKTAVVYRHLSIGLEYQGGRIGYFLQPGDAGYEESVSRGLVVGCLDGPLSENIRWAVGLNNQGTLLGTTGTAIGTGMENTERIIAAFGAGTNYSAGLARAYAGGGFTDWYLPSRDELSACNANRIALGIDAYSCIHSSSENSADKVWVVWNTLAVIPDPKNGGRCVFAVRDF